MTKKIIIAALLAAPLALAGCEGSGADADSTYTPPTTTYSTDDKVVSSTAQAPPVIEETVSTEEDIFLGLLDDEGIQYTSEADALLGGLTVCSFIDEGNKSSDLFWEMAIEQPTERILPPVSNEDLPSFMGISVGVLCPEFQGIVERDLAGVR